MRTNPRRMKSEIPVTGTGETVLLLTVNQVAERLAKSGLDDLTGKWVNDQIDRGIIPRVKVAGKRRVRSDVIDRMVARWMKQAC